MLTVLIAMPDSHTLGTVMDHRDSRIVFLLAVFLLLLLVSYKATRRH